MQRAVPTPGDARDDWKIVRAVSEVMGKSLRYSSLEVRAPASHVPRSGSVLRHFPWKGGGVAADGHLSMHVWAACARHDCRFEQS